MNFTFQLTDQERQDIARALGHLIRALTNGMPQDGKDSAPDSRQGRLPMAEAASVRGGRAAASALLSPPSLTEQMPPRDRWSEDFKTDPKRNSTYPESYTVRIWKCEQQDGKRGPFLDVRWDHRRAYCHAKELFPWILNASKTRQQIILYLIEQDKFPKIVGVQA